MARRHAFLLAAREVFLEAGYEAASVNEVVRRAGGSLATLYAQYGNKEGLFLAVLQDQHERFIRAMTPESVDHLPLEAGLQAIGEHFVKSLLARENLAVFRILIGEGRKFPEEMQRYIGAGADKVGAVIAGFLALHQTPVQNRDLAASQLMELWRSRHHYRALADPNHVVAPADIKAHVAAAIGLFLHGALKPS